jgi:hypothetical protein
MLAIQLREDAELRRDFIEYMNVDSALSDLAALSEAEAADIEFNVPLNYLFSWSGIDPG